MLRLSDAVIKKLVNLLREGEPLPEDYKIIFFENKKDYELVCDGKDRADDFC